MDFNRGKTQFLMGIQTVTQLEEWLHLHFDVRGVAFIGRSNVGKSSLINSLVGNQTARVSKTPGRTRQVNIFQIFFQEDEHNNLPTYLFDVPGYGHAEVSKEMQRQWDDLLNTFFNLLSQRVILLNIQDARHPLQKSDEAFHEYISEFDQETFLVFNKIDKLKTQKERAVLQKSKAEIFKRFKWIKQIYFVSAERGDGIEGLKVGVGQAILRLG
jgi:GTP-binding protein